MTQRSEVAWLVDEHLPAAPCRVLEIGCGAGELARELAGQGYAVVAIDPAAPAGDIFRAESLEQFNDPDRFDAVVASRSLHHIANLDAAVAKIATLVRPDGRLLVHEHAWERFDDATARWYLEQGGRAKDWRQHHRDLHTSEAMLAALARSFTRLHFAWAPYLCGELGIPPDEERALIETGAIQATGFSYVGASAG